MQDIHYLSIAEASTLIAARHLSPLELVDALLDRIARLDGELNSYLLVTADRARDQARNLEAELSRGHCRGPMHGIPYALKDAFATAGIRTTGQSKIFVDNVPKQNAAVVDRLEEAGGILLGKLATNELTFGGVSFDLPWPPARNPWDRERDPGGSSSGSGVAVAAGLCLVALGTDTGGSIRKPAGWCGIVGFKPTYGLVSRSGVMSNSHTLDTCGPMARSVEDAAIVLAVIAGQDPRDPASLDRKVDVSSFRGDIKGVRIGVVRSFYERDLPASEEVCISMERAVEIFAELGASITDCELPRVHDFARCKVEIQQPEIYSVYCRELEIRPHDFSPRFLQRIMPGREISAVTYLEAQAKRRRLTTEMLEAMKEVDVLVMPAPYGPGPLLVDSASDPILNKPDLLVPFSVARMPAICLCNGFSAKGPPLSMQIAGRPWDDIMVLRVADAYERATPWHQRHPVP
jgi:aspartyl-tRNA(Asn)/glutamyl-tRNA(Gln) amidotransferase subunit A